MRAMMLTGNGGLDKLQWRDDAPVPVPGAGEVLIKVAAASVNNTDINTRIGWYAKTVRGDTGSGAVDGLESGLEGEAVDNSDSSWSGADVNFPRIQGADCCGRIVAVGDGVDPSRIGERVLVRTMQSVPTADDPLAIVTFGADFDGAFADYTKARAEEALPVTSDWSDLELATIPCAYSTAEAMIQRASIGAERVLITGASGGVGSAAVQLAHRRGATLSAMTSPDKAEAVRALGATHIIGRDDPIPDRGFDAIIDLVGGPRWPALLEGLCAGGRYVTSGAIAGPIVELDLRTLYLRDLTLFGSTHQPDRALSDVIGYIEAGEISPQIAATYDLTELRAAQEAFLSKSHVGKIAITVAPG
jgi:NADPH:quinone reductase-like Zn-dependent oxidoreductase